MDLQIPKIQKITICCCVKFSIVKCWGEVRCGPKADKGERGRSRGGRVLGGDDEGGRSTIARGTARVQERGEIWS